jgi:oxygen-independent coproporphyrinogen-3 oxidase
VSAPSPDRGSDRSEDPSEGPGLYVHVPFCDRACPYCDFDFEVGRGLEQQAAAWLAGLERERGERAAELEGRVFDTIYVGGGTPSALSLAHQQALLAWLERSFLDRDRARARPRELSFELNPEHASPARLDALVAQGVDRVSLGVQSLDAEGLRQLGRAHGPAEALAAVRACVERGLRTSADVIVGWPGHDGALLERELDELIAAGVEHLSIYALTIEPDTPWPKLVRRGLRVLPDEDLQGDLLALAERHLLARGFIHYEVASYARPGAEAIHNGKYWRWVDVVGLGPSAASVHIDQGVVERRINARGLGAWLAGEAPERERLVGARAAAEGLWLGLRRLRGLDVTRFLDRFGVDRSWLEARVRRQLELGNLCFSRDGELLSVAEGRWLWHDGIAVDLLDPGGSQ